MLHDLACVSLDAQVRDFPERWDTRSIEDEVFDHQHVNLRRGETQDCIDRRTHDWFAAQVERSVENYWAISAAIELFEQCCEARIGFSIHRLHSRRTIDVRDRGQVDA